jgi:hypothetical protein
MLITSILARRLQEHHISAMAAFDLTDEEARAPCVLDADPYAMAARLRTLRTILDKLDSAVHSTGVLSPMKAGIGPSRRRGERLRKFGRRLTASSSS